MNEYIPIGCPWHSKLNDKKLLELYYRALKAKANEDFIKLILEEINSRGIITNPL